MTRHVIRARLELLPTSEGGRAQPIESGYRSLARFDGLQGDVGFELNLEDRPIRPGESGIARLSFWATDVPFHLLTSDPFEVREGGHVVGHGTIVETLT